MSNTTQPKETSNADVWIGVIRIIGAIIATGLVIVFLPFVIVFGAIAGVLYAITRI